MLVSIFSLILFGTKGESKSENNVAIFTYHLIVEDEDFDEEGLNKSLPITKLSDFENEMKLALANRSQSNKVETIFMVSSPEYSFLSSSLVREIASFKGDVSNLVPKVVDEALKRKYKEG